MKKLANLSKNKSLMTAFYVSAGILLIVSIGYFSTRYLKEKFETETKIPAGKSYKFPNMSPEDKAKAIQGLRSLRPPAMSETEKARARESLDNGTLKIEMTEQEKKAAIEGLKNFNNGL